MPANRDEVDRSNAELDNPAIERSRKIELVRKLIKLRKDQRVGHMLVRLLGSESDNEVLKTVVLGVGMLRDKRYAQALLPFVEHPSMRVTAAAIKSLCKLDPNMEVQTLHPLLASRDDKARLAAVLALMSQNPRLGDEMLVQLAQSPTESLRHTAVKCLEAIPLERARALVVEMFIPETRMPVLKNIARAIKKRGVSREGLEKLNGYRSTLKASHPADDEERAMREAKLAILERLSRRSYEKLDLSAGTIGTLEGLVEKQAVVIEHKVVQEAKSKELERRTGQQKKLTAKQEALRRGPSWVRVFGGLVAVMMLAAGVHVSLKSDPQVVKLVAPEKVEIPSVLGKAGEHIAVDGEVLHVYKAQRSLALMGQHQGPVMMIAVFAAGLPPGARTGAKVRVEGVIHDVKSTTSLTIAAEKLVPAT